MRVDLDVDPVSRLWVLERRHRCLEHAPVVQPNAEAYERAHSYRGLDRSVAARAAGRTATASGLTISVPSTFVMPRKRAVSSSTGRAQSSSGVATWTTRPCRITATRSPSVNASVWSWVT